MATFVTSDWHLGHAKILTLGKGRPFETIEAMNETIIRNLNEACGPADTLYQLGDVCCGIGPDKATYARQVRARLRAGRIISLRGNHDPKKGGLFDSIWDEVHEMLETTIEGRLVTLCHYPLEHWSWAEKKGAIMLHGHCHRNPPRLDHRARLDVGVDGHDFKPWAWGEILQELSGAQEPRNHHETV